MSPKLFNIDSMTQNDIHRAWLFASKKHNKQLYPGTNLPYIVHIGAVCLELSEALRLQSSVEYVDLTATLLTKSLKSVKEKNSLSLTSCEFAIVCAILHDVLEDTETTKEELEETFSVSVAEAVSSLTKNSNIKDKTEQMVDSLRRIKKQPKEVWLVKLSDRIANLSQFPNHWKVEKCMRYIKESEMILDYLHDASESLSHRLQEKIDEWKTHYKVL